MFLCLVTGNLYAGHISGGEMNYVLVSQSNGNYTYDVTLKLFRICDGGRDINESTIISVFNRGTYVRLMDIPVSLAIKRTISLPNTDPCIQNPPTVCYEVGYFDFTVTLPGNAEGYLLSSQVIFRVNNMSNLQTGYPSIGATYTAEIPGTANLANGPANNSAEFIGSDLVLVCADNALRYSFAASDADGDQLRYRFCNALQTGPGTDPNNDFPPTPPPYDALPYGNGFTGQQPLGNKVSINAATGLITGIAPSAGVYVVTVCVDEIRNGVVIATQRKDLQIKIATCELVAASLPEEYLLCRENTSIQLRNLVNNSLITSHDWEIKNSQGAVIFSANTETAFYTFTDTGTYKVRLIVNKNQPCTDSTFALARVYPGTITKFAFKGICNQQPTRFFDSSKVQYGTIHSWSWNFGDLSNTDDTSYSQNPIYQYTTNGDKQVTLFISTSTGCSDSVSQLVNITDKPPLQFSFTDTLICKGDTLRLQGNADGQYQWSPGNSMLQSTTASPSVFPSVTTTYHAILNVDGCVNTDSVKVQVKDSVQLQVMKDTTICQNDSIQLRITSDGLKYAWQPAVLFTNATLKEPVIQISSTTQLSVTASIGGCTQARQLTVSTVPYPNVFAGNDSTICYNSVAWLNGATNGAAFSWSPVQNLVNATTLSPHILLSKTSTFVLTATDTKGCPKPARDSVTITVLPALSAFAGNDTAVVVNQPLQLMASGGSSYVWKPATYLSAAEIENPVAIFPFPIDKTTYTVYVSNAAGCNDSASLSVKVFKTLPTIFVPTAFTPNADGNNDVLRPILAGMKNLEYFRVYNRWGQLIFSTTTPQMGWNGNYKGKPQATGSFVWMVKAIDYTGKPYFEKGVVTLLR